ncbi:putative outer membrane protein [Nonlabens tegetincola]|uniref:Putative outer membrane protein n=1 Tax=Nonlabens tegetincola TaxID=323273 RepID=A0A090QLH8_9FLAO|nr:carboxypeptidase-like regulatory domain-containing protein [Nonlabens tegetincola]GAK96376.1 putative outer membrane protein [Nonlabens tegetincola]
MRSILFFYFTSLIALSCLAQEQVITGTVGDEDGPIYEAIVIVKGTTKFTQTDFDGNYTIKAKEGDVLVFSYVGYESQEVKVLSQKSIHVTLIGSMSCDLQILTSYLEPDQIGFAHGVNYHTYGLKLNHSLFNILNTSLGISSSFNSNLYLNFTLGTDLKFNKYHFIGFDMKLYSLQNISFNQEALVFEIFNTIAKQDKISLFLKASHLYYQDVYSNFNEIGIGAAVTSSLALGISQRTSFDYFKSVNVFSTRLTKDFYIGNRQFNTSINYQHLERFEEFTIGLGYHF